MQKMDNLDYSFMVRELSKKLIGRHFNRIRRIGEGVYRVKIGSLEVLCELGVRIHLTRFLEEAEPPDRFVQKMEKELDNAKLISIEQVNLDRIISFVFNRGSLVFEMFGKGNIILVREGNIIDALKHESWADREIRPGMPYKAPPKKPGAELELSDKYVIVSLMRLPLGKGYALEALRRAGIDEKTPGSGLSEGQVACLKKEIGLLRSSTRPLLFMRDGSIMAYSLTGLSQYSGYERREMPSLSEALDEYHSSFVEVDPELEKLQRRLEKQEERLGSLSKDEVELKEKGDLIYEKYIEIESILAAAKSGKADGLERYKAIIDKKEKSVEVEL